MIIRNCIVANAVALNDKRNAEELVKEFHKDLKNKIGGLYLDAKNDYDILSAYATKFRDIARAESSTAVYKQIELLAIDILPDLKKIVNELSILSRAAAS